MRVMKYVIWVVSFMGEVRISTFERFYQGV